jgi:hypothetical protein
VTGSEVTSTGIPIELLFAAIGVMVMACYGGLVWELRKLRSSGVRRDRLLVLICDRLKINFDFNGE